MMKVIHLLLLVVGLAIFGGIEARKSRILESFEYSAISCRAHTASIQDFGGVGDGKTLNTEAFRQAVDHLSQFASDGGAQLFVPAGKWLTGSFNLTSHFTLYLHRDAALLASQDISSWPVVDPLPSYGHGRDAPGGRYISLIFGTNLTDVVVTGDNGTIDGQGDLWWQQFHKKKLKYTRPYLIEIMHSDGVQISDLTFLNSPSWNVHPVYSRNVIIQGLTILAPVTSPNTDGINPGMFVYLLSNSDARSDPEPSNRPGSNLKNLEPGRISTKQSGSCSNFLNQAHIYMGPVSFPHFLNPEPPVPNQNLGITIIVGKIGPEIEPVRLLVQWFTGRTTGSLVGPPVYYLSI